MNTEQVSHELVDFLKQGNFEGAQKALFHPQVVSIEPGNTGLPKTDGLENVLKKGAQFRQSVAAWHGIAVSKPVLSKDHFSIALKVDLTFKGQKPSSLDEIIVYEVNDGKIVTETFYY